MFSNKKQVESKYTHQWELEGYRGTERSRWLMDVFAPSSPHPAVVGMEWEVKKHVPCRKSV